MVPLSLRSRSFSFVFLVAVLVSQFAPCLYAEGVMQGFESEIQGIFDRTKDAVVQVKTILPVTDSKKGDLITEALSIGTGFFVDNKGHLFTAASVLRGSDRAVVYWRGKAYEAQSLGQDPRTNLALLKIDAETPSLPFGDPENLKVGSIGLAVGYPADAPIAAEYGFISNPETAQLPKGFATTHIRSSVRAHPGQSGSPFLNSKGEVVGMVVASMQDGSSTFALPITAAKKIQGDLVKHHAPRHGWTGLTVVFRNDLQSTDQGIAVRDVYQNSPGHLAGLSPGDLLVKVGDKDIKTPADVLNSTFYLSVGETVNFTIERDGENKIIPIKVVPRPSEADLVLMPLLHDKRQKL
jgi:S1-C subfamily serine protease